MSDEIYGEMVYGGAHASLTTYPELTDRLILLDGWSKTYAMTGWRLGYGVWPASLFPYAERLAINCHSCVNAAAQYAGIAALTGPREPSLKMVEAFAERRAYIVPALNALPGFRCANPGGAFYAFPNISGTGFDSRTLQSRLLDEAGRRHRLRHQFRRLRRRVHPVLLRRQPGGVEGSRRPHRRMAGTPAGARQRVAGQRVARRRVARGLTGRGERSVATAPYCRGAAAGSAVDDTAVG